MDLEKYFSPYLSDKYFFDEEAATLPIQFIENYCRITKDGALFNKGDLMKVQDYQAEVIVPVFGIKKKEDGRRRFQIVWNEMPKKQGKSGLLSALSLFLLGPGGEQGGQGFGAANQRTQAGLILEDAKEMIRMDKYLSNAYEIRQYHIDYEKNASQYKVVSAEASGIHGINPTFVFYDEIHAGTVDHQVKALWDALRKSFITRANPLLWSITNSGIKGTYAHDLHKYAKKVEQGVLRDDRWFVKTYNAPEDADIFDKKTFVSVNPGFGKVIPESYWDELETELRNDPLSIDVSKRLNYGIWVSTTTAWSIADIWERGNLGATNLEDYKGYEAIVGLDLADGRDLCSAAVIIPPTFYTDDGKPYLFKENKNKEFIWFALHWTPSAMVDQRMRDESIHFKEWIESGHVAVTSGDFRDSETIAADIIDYCQGLDVVKLGFDRAKADIVVPRLMEAGYECEPWPQTPYAMDNVVQKMDELITNKEVNHQGNPVLEWQIGNVELYADREQNKWVHKTKSTGKIDGIVAFLNGMKSYMELIKDPEIVSDPSEWIW